MALCCAAFVVIRLAMERGGSRYDGSPRSEGPAGDSLASLIVDLRKEHNLVGIGAMVTVDDQVEAAAVQGERKAGSGVPLELGDRWHLGGISKSVTATMIARLIEPARCNGPIPSASPSQMRPCTPIGSLSPSCSY